MTAPDPTARPLRRALLSVSDKHELVPFARALHESGCELIATGGTCRALAEAGLPVTPVAEVTGAGELLGGRVKSLHPAIHGGILARDDQAEELRAAGIAPIDLVCVNLYPFRETLAKGATGIELLEQIDIGGPAMLRAAAKNHPRVAVLTEPADYGLALEELAAHGGLTDATRARLAAKAFARAASYDAAIAAALSAEHAPEGEQAAPATLVLAGVETQALRYGENPHQQARWARAAAPAGGADVGALVQLSGQGLSTTNLLDVDGALRLITDLPAPAAAVLKHAGPCGAASGAGRERGIVEVFDAAYEGDPLSAFGGVAVVSERVDAALAAALTAKGRWFEIIIAPSFSPAALDAIQNGPRWGQRVRLLALDDQATAFPPQAPQWETRTLLGGGLLSQLLDPGARLETPASVTSTALPVGRESDVQLAWRLVAHVKSNAIALVNDGALVGVGGGQPSRVDAARIALEKAGERARGAVLASDAFFPFADTVEAAAAAGVAIVVQPGGSRRDAEVIAAAEAAGMAMLMTGQRHFRH